MEEQMSLEQDYGWALQEFRDHVGLQNMLVEMEPGRLLRVHVGDRVFVLYEHSRQGEHFDLNQCSDRLTRLGDMLETAKDEVRAA